MIHGSQIIDSSISIIKLLADASLDMAGNRLINLGAPVNDNDGVPKIFVLQKSNSDTNKAPVKVATTASNELQNTNNVAYVYNNVTDVWTNVLSPKQIDGVTLLDGDRILIKNATDARGNGIWIYSVANTNFVRSDDCRNDVTNNIVRLGISCFTNAGTTNKGAGFILSSSLGSPVAADGVYALGTDTLTFNQFNGVGVLIAGNAIQKNGNTINVLFDDLTIGISTNSLYVKNGSISSTQLAANSVITNKILNTAVTYDKLNANVVYTSGAISLLVGTPGYGLAVNVDDTSISIIDNKLTAIDSHSHVNLSILDLFAEASGVLSWNGNEIATNTENTSNISNNATTIIPIIDMTLYRAAHITYTLERNGFYATGSIKMLHDGNNPGLETEFISLPTNSNLGINFDASISGNTLQLNAIADNSGSDAIFKYKITQLTL